jgi:rSAM/selenodomain-associated transferase 1
VLLFAKAPEPGRVKTRLIPALGEDGAAALAARMLHHALEAAVAARIGPVELVAEPLDHPHWGALPSVARSAQGEGDLGARMARAVQRTIEQGECALLIGSDCPALDGPMIATLAWHLDDHDAAIIPAGDGGYVALALARFDAFVFADIAWSSAEVLPTTLERLATLGWRVAVMPAMHDIDDPADLAHVPVAWLPVPSR